MRKPDAAKGYEAHKVRARRRMAQLSAAGRDIGPLPEVAEPARRAESASSFKRFCEIYFPATFCLPWSPDHLKVIARIEQAVRQGGLFALAMPRSSGKTSLCEVACIWAIAIGARRFIVLIGSDKEHAEKMLDSIKSELETNEVLLADWPELAYPVVKLDGIANRCKGQVCGGRRTYIEWTAKHIALASLSDRVLKRGKIPEANGTGAIIVARGLTGRIRGQKHKRPDGTSPRPDLVVLDDPQTEESAKSDIQCRDREGILKAAVLGLAARTKMITAFMPCTVMRKGDMADHVLDRKIYPQWQGERFKMVYEFPTAQALWEQYGDIRTASFQNGGRGEEATEFYRQHRKEMDEGAVVAWPEAFAPEELSGLQAAMNLKLQSEEVFCAEYQNDPLAPSEEEHRIVTADEVAAKVNGRLRGRIPAGADLLTAFVDCQQKLLYYAVCAWQKDFTGYVVDYGTYPEQPVHYFTMREVQRTVGRAHPGKGVEGALYAALDQLTSNLLGREWPREDGAVMRIRRLLIDQGWKTDTVHEFCRQSIHAPVLMPSKGSGIGASQVPIAEYRRNAGDRIGTHWWIPSMKGRRVLRHVEVDTNFWKTFIHDRFATATGDKGCLSIWGGKGTLHRMLGGHVTAEYRVPTQAKGRQVDEWKSPPSNPDNHLFDCLVGCATAASMEGVELGGIMGAPARQEPKRLKLSELQAVKERR